MSTCCKVEYNLIQTDTLCCFGGNGIQIVGALPKYVSAIKMEVSCMRYYAL